MKDEVIFISEGNCLTARLIPEIDHHAAREVRERIDERFLILKPSRLVLDFSKVRFMDSSGIALILGRSELARSAGASVEIRGLSHTLGKLVRLSGVDRVENIRIVG